jgi:hypothetical protein
MATFREIVEAPRWAGFQTLVKDLAWGYGLKLDLQADKGWIRETVRFSVEGEDSKVASFKRDLYASLEDYQRRVSAART